VNNKGKASKRRKPTNEVGALICVLADTQGNNDKEEELGKAAFQNVQDNKKEEEEFPQSAFPYCKDLLFGTDHNDKSHLIIKTSQLSLFVTTSIIMGLGFFCTRTCMRFSLTYS
jgi:hypothetical protein